jgi:hypothetical protein
MKLSKIKLGVVWLSLAVTLGGVSLWTASAENSTMSTQQITQIRNNCVSAKNTLSQLHASDALLRVNRGQLYESISTKLMAGFNGRVSNNSYDNTDLVFITKEYNLALDTFRTDYIKYEEKLSTAMAVDCTKQPVAFYDEVSSARSERDQVHSDAEKLDQYVDQYKTAISSFESYYQSKKSSSGQ